MPRSKRLWPLEVVILTAGCAAVYWCGAYQLLHLYFLSEFGSDMTSTRRVIACVGIVLVMAYVRRYPFRHAVKGLVTGEVTAEDFQSWRRQFDRTRWVVLAALLALPAAAVIFNPVWNGSWLLFLLPAAMLVHVRSMLRLPDPTHPNNRLTGPPSDP